MFRYNEINFRFQFFGIVISTGIGFYVWKKQKNTEIRLDIYKKLISSLGEKLFPILVDSSVTIKFFENLEPISIENKELSRHIHQLKGFVSLLYKFKEEFLVIISNWGMFLKEKTFFRLSFL